ncbi:IS66 family insertion sequence element accessory protein TnpB [Xanthobacter sp. V3C-3]|uniref:IS66 family insertion sequence element accessory protein TnpB n=1 Tax=Xanthobacter lutulentifluminis TaxID=3119935 RepID=UPI00372983D9
MLVQGVLGQDPFSGHLFVFRGRARANLIKIVYWDGTRLCHSPSGSSKGSSYERHLFRTRGTIAIPALRSLGGVVRPMPHRRLCRA